jgi:rRNA maturation endonuclease Nob1
MIAQKSNSNKLKNIVIFDTNIFLLGVDFNLIGSLIYSTPEVIKEVQDQRYLNKNRNVSNRIQAAIESKKLILQNPSEKYFLRIEKYSKDTGDYNALSPTDKGLIALSLELKETLNQNIILYTNDFSMQNLCSELKITFSPLIRDGIKSRIIWEVYCPFCKELKKVEEYGENCERCGSKLKRKRKSEIRL